jgi:hypothetical protein
LPSGTHQPAEPLDPRFVASPPRGELVRDRLRFVSAPIHPYARVDQQRGIPMLTVQDDLMPASGILIGVSIGTALWEVAIFVVWHVM